MSNEEIIQLLKNLAQVDIDAKFSYEVALEKVPEDEIKNTIKTFKEDHERHITELNLHLNQLGVEPVEIKRDLKGMLIEGYTMMRSATGTKGALKAMQVDEKITNKAYAQALNNQNLPQTIRSLIEKNYNDEKRHLTYVTNILEQI